MRPRGRRKNETRALLLNNIQSYPSFRAKPGNPAKRKNNINAATAGSSGLRRRSAQDDARIILLYRGRSSRSTGRNHRLLPEISKNSLPDYFYGAMHRRVAPEV